MKEMARAWKISPKALYDIINRQRETGSAAALPRSGRPSVLTDADETVLAELSEELDGEYTWEEIKERFNEKTGKKVSKATVFRFCKSRGWRERGASLEDAPTSKECSLVLCPTLCRDKKIEKVSNARFFDFYTTVMLHRSI